MMQKTCIIALSCILVFSVFTVLLPTGICPGISEGASGNTLYAGGSGNGNYSNIQDAINAASNGDTVYVYSGIYNGDIGIDKSIALLGEDSSITIIDGGKSENVISLSSDSITIAGFTIRNSGVSDAGIYISSNYNNIHNNTISNNGYGIQLKNAVNNIILNNNIYNNRDEAIRLSNCSKNTIRKNTVTNNQWYGIIVTFEGPSGKLFRKESKNNIIDKNTFNNNEKDGIYLFLSNGNIVSNNSIQNNSGHGILLHGCNNTITENTVINNQNSGVYVVEKWDAPNDNNTISANIIKDNYEYGIYLYEATGHTIISNEIINNKYGISTSGNNNSIQNNTVENNNRFGISVQHDNNDISGNVINNNDNGTWMLFCNNNSLTSNIISNNTCGIRFETGNNNNIADNLFENNDVGVYLSNWWSHGNNQISDNTFSNNGEDIHDEGKIWEEEHEELTSTFIIYSIISIIAHLSIAILAGIWMYKDAKKRGTSGIPWLVIGILTGIIGLIIWLILRPPKPSKEPTFPYSTDTLEKYKKTPERPDGITILAVLEAVSGIYTIVTGLFILPALYMMHLISGEISSGIGLAGEIGGTSETSPDFTILLIALGTIVIVIATLHFMLAYGFWKGKSWAWKLGIIFPIVGIVGTIGIYIISPKMENLVSIIPSTIIGLIIIFYLTRSHVKAYFGKTETEDTSQLY